MVGKKCEREERESRIEPLLWSIFSFFLFRVRLFGSVALLARGTAKVL